MREAERRMVLLAFAAFGVVWGVYAAALPGVKAATGASDAALGAALAGIGVTALPAMWAVGRVIDRRADRAVTAALCGFALTAPLPMLADSVPTLVVALLAFGACSGAFDVTINHAAVAAEAEAGRRLLDRAHATFSAGLLAGSVLTGLARAAGVAPAVPVGAVAVALLCGALPARRTVCAPRGRGGPAAGERPAVARRWGGTAPFVALAGLVGALALVVENGLQQWSAVLLEDVLGAGPAVAGLGPAVLSAAAVAGRLGGHALGRRLADARLLTCSGLLAAPGVLLVATAGNAASGLSGLLVAGVAISVATPSLYRLAGRRVPVSHRGRTISTVSALAYVGLLGGPGLVGAVAGRFGLRTGLGCLAVAALAVAALAVPLGRRVSNGDTPEGCARPA